MKEGTTLNFTRKVHPSSHLQYCWDKWQSSTVTMGLFQMMNLEDLPDNFFSNLKEACYTRLLYGNSFLNLSADWEALLLVGSRTSAYLKSAGF